MNERQLAEINANLHLLLKGQQSMLAVLKPQSPKKDDSRERPPKSKRLSKDDKRIRDELKSKLPKYLTVQETAEELHIPPSNFYRNVCNIYLFPVYPNGGKHPRYRRADVIKLKLGVTHEPGAHTFSKLKKSKSVKKGSQVNEQ